MKNVDDLFRAKDNKPESKYGSTRSTLFGKFYERIIAKWLELKKDYQLKRRRNGAVCKPRIEWKEIVLGDFDIAQESSFNQEKVRQTLQSKFHCTPDGLFECNEKVYIWEAKNWPLYPDKGPKVQIWNYLSEHPWILATTCICDKTKREISGFLFSFWDIDFTEKNEIEHGVNRIIGKAKFEIILSNEIIEDCIQNQYDWYVDIITEEKCNIDTFFDQLLGK